MEKALNIERWWTNKTVAVVTGSNQGIGLSILRGLAIQGINTILTARNEERGKAAVEAIRREAGIDVKFHQLDISDPESIQKFATWLEQEFGRLDILVNNAGVNQPSAEAIIATNYYGTKAMIQAMLPLMKKTTNSRIVNVSSMSGELNALTTEVASSWKCCLSDLENLTEKTIDSFIKEYLNDIQEAKNIKSKGWPIMFGVPEGYAVSKISLNCYTRILARELQKSGQATYVNCMCPGGTKTQLSGGYGHSPDIGAECALCLSLLPSSQCSTGKFFVKKLDVGYDNIPLLYKDRLAWSPDERDNVVKNIVADIIS